MNEIYVVRFWRMDEPYQYTTKFEDGAAASEFVEKKQAQGYLTTVTTEQQADETEQKILNVVQIVIAWIRKKFFKPSENGDD